MKIHRMSIFLKNGGLMQAAMLEGIMRSLFSLICGNQKGLKKTHLLYSQNKNYLVWITETRIGNVSEPVSK